MTCTSMSCVYLCQILFSFQDVYEFPTVRGIEMFTVCLGLVVIDCESIKVRIGWKNLALNFGGIFGAIFQANNERSKSTLVVRHFLLILAK